MRYITEPATPERLERMLDSAISGYPMDHVEAKRVLRRKRRPSPLLIDEIHAGMLGPVDRDRRGLFLVYQRDAETYECSAFRLILAPSPSALFEYIDGKPPGVCLTARVVNLRYPGQVWAAEHFFSTRMEVAGNEPRANRRPSTHGKKGPNHVSTAVARRTVRGGVGAR